MHNIGTLLFPICLICGKRVFRFRSKKIVGYNGRTIGRDCPSCRALNPVERLKKAIL
jgi:hypothetical protein